MLPVTCYRRVRNAVVPSLCLRSAFASGSLQVHFRFAPIDGASTDLKRTYNGPASESVESSRGITLKSVFSLGNGFGMVFTFYIVLHRFSSILNKVKLPEINAYCYAIETISHPISCPLTLHNSLIIFILDSHKQDPSLAQQASKIMASNG